MWYVREVDAHIHVKHTCDITAIPFIAAHGFRQHCSATICRWLALALTNRRIMLRVRSVVTGATMFGTCLYEWVFTTPNCVCRTVLLLVGMAEYPNKQIVILSSYIVCTTFKCICVIDTEARGKQHFFCLLAKHDDDMFVKRDYDQHIRYLQLPFCPTLRAPFLCYVFSSSATILNDILISINNINMSGWERFETREAGIHRFSFVIVSKYQTQEIELGT